MGVQQWIGSEYGAVVFLRQEVPERWFLCVEILGNTNVRIIVLLHVVVVAGGGGDNTEPVQILDASLNSIYSQKRLT